MDIVKYVTFDFRIKKRQSAGKFFGLGREHNMVGQKVLYVYYIPIQIINLRICQQLLLRCQVRPSAWLLQGNKVKLVQSRSSLPLLVTAPEFRCSFNLGVIGLSIHCEPELQDVSYPCSTVNDHATGKIFNHRGQSMLNYGFVLG